MASPLRDLVDQWCCEGGLIAERNERREVFNIMQTIPPGRWPESMCNAARESSAAELGKHRFAMVLHIHRANPHVHLAVRPDGRDGRRLNPRKQGLRRWREVFAEKLCGRGIEAEASSRVTRGGRHHNERLWQREAREQRRATENSSTETRLTPSRRHAAQAWWEIAKALASSEMLAGRELGRAVVDDARWLPGLERTPTQRTRPEPGWVREPKASQIASVLPDARRRQRPK